MTVSANYPGASAETVANTIAQPVELNGQRLYVTTSIGITLFPDDGDDAETLLKNADNAMYRAKAEGRNTYQMSTQELNRSTHERMTLESGLHLAMERNEFELFYQPQIDVRTMRIVGMEALLRWRHPERGLVPPAGFSDFTKASPRPRPLSSAGSSPVSINRSSPANATTLKRSTGRRIRIP